MFSIVGLWMTFRGPTDFGWDPVFEPEGFAETFAEMDKGVKNGISHRSKALGAVKAYLTKNRAMIEKALRKL